MKLTRTSFIEYQKVNIFSLKIGPIENDNTVYIGNLSIHGIRQAYDRGSKMINIDFLGLSFDGISFVKYEEDFLEELIKRNLIPRELLAGKRINNFIPTKREFDYIFLEICKIGNPKFEYSIETHTVIDLTSKFVAEVKNHLPEEFIEEWGNPNINDPKKKKK